MPSAPSLVRANVLGPVATGTIYTTLLNLNDLQTDLPVSQPYLATLSATGTVLSLQPVIYDAIDYQPYADGTYTIGHFFGDNPIKQGWYELHDRTGKIRTTLYMRDNPNTDVHGITKLRNGDFIIPSYKMHYQSDGSRVQSFVLEEQRPDGTVVFTWDSLDHVPLTAKTDHELRTYWKEQHINDYFHGNSVAEMDDGNLLVSGRHVDALYKIDRHTGKVIWQLGGKASDFTFVDDPKHGFSHQHSVRVLPNDHILLYDNGNGHTPQRTRVVEYALNEHAKTARLVWSYSDGRFTYAAGSVERLDNGNTLIGWGLEAVPRMSSTTPRITEVSPDGKPVLQIYFPDDSALYNVFKR